jgi:hypothetical protein
MEALQRVKLDGFIWRGRRGSKPATSAVTVRKNLVTDRNQETGWHLLAP